MKPNEFTLEIKYRFLAVRTINHWEKKVGRDVFSIIFS